MRRLLLCFIALTGLFLNANALPKIGAELGLNLSKMTYSSNNVNISTSNYTGYRVGLILDAKLVKHIHFQPGLFYSAEGTTFSGGFIKPNYLRIPVNFIYRLGLPGVGHVFFGAGPVLGYCLGGKIDPGTGSQSLKIGSDAASDLKAMDVGFDVNAGYQLPIGVFFRLSYIAGLSNIAPQDGTVKNSSFVISAGWIFGGLL